MTTGAGATTATAPRSAAPSIGDKRASAIGIRPDHRRTIAAKANVARIDRSYRDGLPNAVICITVMLACVIAYILLARMFVR